MKKEYLILVAVIFALLAYLFLQDKNKTHFKLPEIAAMDSAKTDRIQIVREGHDIELTRKDDRWFIQPKDYPADDTRVKNMLKAATDLQITALVSESGNYERYDLSDNKKITVQFKAGDHLQRELEIGRTAPTYQHTFVKLAGDDKVYHAKGSLQNTFNVNLESLRDKNVLTFDQAAVTALDLKKGDLSLSLVKKEILPEEKKPEEEKEKVDPAQKPKAKTVWQTSDGKEADQATVERLLSSFSRLQCDGFDEGKTKTGFKDPAWQLVFKAGQQTYTVAAQTKQGDTNSPVDAISSASAYVFNLSQPRAENFEKQIDKVLGIEAEKKK